MQEELSRKLRKTAKKIVAVGTSAFIASMSLTGAALATDLGDLPKPFITSGVFDSYVVVGASADPADVVGAIDIATAFGQEATSSASASGMATLGVTQFEGKSTSIDIDADKITGNVVGSGPISFSNSDDLDILDDLISTISSGEEFNATETISINKDWVRVNLADFSISMVASANDTVADVPINITLGNNRTATGGYFEEGDFVKWGTSLYEITDIVDETGTADDTISVGTSKSTVVTNAKPEFDIGEKSFTLIEVLAGDKATITDAAGNYYTVNTSYSKIDTVNIKVKPSSAVAGNIYQTVTFETQATSYTMKDGDSWLGNSDWKIQTLTVNSSNVVEKLVLRNTFALTGLKETEKRALHSNLDLVYDDDDGKTVEAAFTAGASVINVSEGAQVTMTLTAVNTSAEASGTVNSGWDINGSRADLPGVYFNTHSQTKGVYTYTNMTDLTQLNFTDYTSESDNGNDELLLRDGEYGNYELKVVATPDGTDLLYYLPNDPTNLTSSETNFKASQLTTNHTTPSGVFVDISTDTLKVKAVTVLATTDGSATTYYARAGSSNLAGETTSIYTDYGARLAWTSTSQTAGTLTITEPKGGSIITVGVTFESDGDAQFGLSDVKVDGSAVAFTGVGTTEDYATSFGTLIGNYTHLFEDTTVSPTNYSTTIGVVAISVPQYKVTLGLGGYTETEIVLDTDEDDSTYPVKDTIGNTTVELKAGSGASVTVNKVTPGFARLDSDSMVSDSSELGKPVIIVGGWSVNKLAAELVAMTGGIDSARLIELGAGHAGIYYVEEAFNGKSALLIAGYNAADTVWAARTVASALLSQTPIDFSDYAGETALYLDTGVEAVSGVTVVVEEVVEETTETTEETA